MKTYQSIVLVVVLGSGFVVACGGSDSGTGTTKDPAKPATSGTSTSPTDPAPTAAHDCVKSGDKGNDKGVGAYCEKTAECGSGLLCTKDFGAGPNEPWFCTLPCETNDECGSGAICYEEERGKGCLPLVCQPK